MRHRSDGGLRLSFQIYLREQQRDTAVEDGDVVLRGKCLLVVDDNDTCCKIIQQQASRWGMEALNAISGKEALALLRTRANLQQPVDLLLVDYDMPGMNGLELLDRIEQESEALNLQHVRTLILTGVSKMPGQLAEKKQQSLKVLYKPVSGKSLKMALIDALR